MISKANMITRLDRVHWSEVMKIDIISNRDSGGEKVIVMRPLPWPFANLFYFSDNWMINKYKKSFPAMWQT